MGEASEIPAAVLAEYPTLRRWAARRALTDPALEPDDLVQDALLSFWTSGAAGRCPTTRDALAYLARSMANRAYSLNAARMRHPGAALVEEIQARGPAVEGEALARAELGGVLSGLADDRNRWLETVLLYAQGYTIDEIGAALGVLPASIRPRVHKWRKGQLAA